MITSKVFKFFYYFAIILYFLSFFIFLYFILFVDEYIFIFKCYYSHNMFDWFFFFTLFFLLTLLIKRVVTNQSYVLLFLGLILSGFFFSYLYSRGEFISNRFVKLVIPCDKKQLINVLDFYLDKYNLKISQELKEYLINKNLTKFDLVNELININFYFKNEYVITLDEYLTNYIEKNNKYFYLYIILLFIIFIINITIFLYKIIKITKFEKLLVKYYEHYYYFNDNNVILRNVLKIRYNKLTYRGYSILNINGDGELLENNNLCVLDEFNYNITYYEYRLPFHIELLSTLNIGNISKNYVFLEILLLSTKDFILDDYISLNDLIFNLRKSNKIFFSFIYDGLYIKEKNDNYFSNTYDFLLCISLENTEFIINSIKKMHFKTLFSISELDDVNDYFNRKSYYKKTKGFQYLHLGSNFYFFEYRFDLYKFYIMGEYMLMITIDNNILIDYMSRKSKQLNIINTLFYTFFKSYNIYNKIPSNQIIYLRSFIFVFLLYKKVNYKTEDKFYKKALCSIMKVNFYFIYINNFLLYNKSINKIKKFVYLLKLELEYILSLLIVNKIILDIKTKKSFYIILLSNRYLSNLANNNYSKFSEFFINDVIIINNLVEKLLFLLDE